MDNKVLKKYLRQVRHVYHGDKKLKKQFLQDVEDALLCYAESHPGCSYDNIVHRFGTPTELRESFSSSDMLKRRSILLYRLVILFSVLITLSIILFTVDYVTNSYGHSKGHYTDYIDQKDTTDTSPPPLNYTHTPYGKYTFN
ncbi:MAG: hypothetical protein HFG34_06290 [Eubacterium sp.]|nr:hypothetical protein [Eubacterium sp.]